MGFAERFSKIPKKHLFVVLLLITMSPFVATGQTHKGISFQALIKAPGNNFPTVSNLTVNAKILSSDDCILFEEDYSAVSMSNGYINVVIGQGTRTGADTGKTFAEVMNNNTGTLTGLTCLHPNGTVNGSKTTTTPTDGDPRKYRVSMMIGSDPVVADFNMRSVAYAVNSETLEGRRASTFLSVNSPQGVTQSNVESVFSRYSTLDAILGGSYSGNVTGTAANVTGVVAIANGGTGATTAADARTNLGLGPLAVLPTTGTASASTFLRGDGQWTAVAPGGVTNVATGTGLTGGPITTTGTISLAAGGVSANELATDAVTTAKILDANITTSKIGNLAVTDAKINDVSVDKITSGAAKYFTYRPNNVACAANEVLKWDNGNSRWICGTDAGLTSESDPKVGSNTANYLSKWNGSALVTSGIFENSGRVGIGNATPAANLEITGPAGTDPLLVTANGINTLHVTQTSGVRLRNSYTVEYNSGASRTEFGSFDHNYIVSGFGQSDGVPRNINLLPYAGGGVGIGTTSPGGPLDVFSANGRQFEVLDAGAGSVNYLTATGATTGNAPTVAASGTDTNVPLALRSKGTGSVNIVTGGGTQVRVLDKASSVNPLLISGGATGQGVNLTASGTDTNVGFDVITKGTGTVNFASNNSFSNSNFKIFAVNAATNYLAVTGAATGTSPVLSANGGDTNINLTLTPKGTGNTIISSGNVGIGVAAPADKLDVAGRIRATHLCAPDGTNCRDLTTGWTGGSVTSVTAGTGLTGGTITSTGTIGLGAELAGLNGLATTGIIKRTGAGTYTAGSIDISTTDVSGVLPIARGGTNSGTALNNNRMMRSSAGAIVEMAAMTDGQLIVGKSADTPQIVTMSGDATISNTGTLTLATIPVSKGGTASTSFAANKVITSNGTGTALVGTSCGMNEVISFDAGGSITCVNVTSLMGNAFLVGGNTVTAAAELGTNSNHGLNIETAGTTRISILANGNVGVGTVNPTTLFDVAGTARSTMYEIRQTNQQDLRFNGGSGNQWRMNSAINGATNGNMTLENTTDNFSSVFNKAMTWTPAGNVGIGTPTPGTKLFVTSNVDNASSAIVVSENTNAGTSASAGFSVRNNTGEMGYLWSGSSAYTGGGSNYQNRMTLSASAASTGLSLAAEGAGDDMRFMTGGATAAFERLRIDANGNVGIGTTSPGRLLHVAGPMRLTPAALPGTPAAGDIAVDSTASNALKWYNGSAWQTIGTGTGSVTSITAGTGLTGGAITTSGTIGLGTELAGLNGVATTGVLKRTGAGTYTAGALDLSTSDFTGVLPIARGGTNSGTALNNNRMITSSGGAIVEMAAMTDGQLIVGKSASAPQIVTLSGDATISNTGAVTLATVPVSKGGTAATSFAANRLIASNGTGSALVATTCALNQVISFDASGNITCANVSSLFSNAFVDGGNTFTGTATLGTNSNHDLAIETNGTTRMSVTNAGNVGIGTTSPIALFQIEGGASASRMKFTNTATGTAVGDGFNIEVDNGGQTYLLNYENAATVFYTNGSEKMRIANTGNVGIGTTSPTSRLQVTSAAADPEVKIGPSAAAGSNAMLSLIGKNGGTEKSSMVMVDWAGHLYLKTESGNVINFGHYSNQSQMVLDTSTGNLGIGTTSPTTKLEIAQGNAIKIGNAYLSSGGSAYAHLASNAWYNGTAWVIPSATQKSGLMQFNEDGFTIHQSQTAGASDFAPRLTILSGGNTGIGTATPTQKLDVAGYVRATGYFSTSDRRLKRDIATVEGLDKITKMRGVRFNWIGDGSPEVGLIAQEVEEVFPELVTTDANGYKSVRYQSLVGPLIEATKELNQKCEMSQAQQDEMLRRIQSLESENAVLKANLKMMDDRLKALESKAK